VSDIDAFFERIETIAEPKPPKKVDSSWVESYGFQTAHPSAIPSMLRWLGVINDESESTGVWNSLRVDSTRAETVQRLVEAAYAGIFDAVEVEKASTRDLRGAFVSVYSLGDPGRHIKCFLALCRQGRIVTAGEASAGTTTPSDRPKSAPDSKRRSRPQGVTTPPTRRRTPRPRETGDANITLNVEIPADWTEDQIRARIAAVSRAADQDV
jgi:hypothetical protein